MIGSAGQVGGFAATILAALDAAGIDRRQGVRAGPSASGMSVAIPDAAGDYGAVVVSGVIREIVAEEIGIAPDTRVLVLQNEIPTAVNLALVARLPDSVRLILDAAPARDLPEALLNRTDCLIVNRVDAAMMTGGRQRRSTPTRRRGSLSASGPRR